MRFLIDYIRSCFCKHQWKLLEEELVYENNYTDRPLGTRRTYIAKSALDGK